MTYDYIIVGQGVAGTLLAFELLERHQKILVVDAAHQATASKVAAGIINPITGRHLVNSWNIDTLLPKAWSTYRALEKLLDITVLEERPLTRFLATVKANNDWLVRSSNPDLQAYLSDDFDPEDYRDFLQHFESGVVLRHTGRVRLAALTAAFRTYLQQQDALLEASFDYAQLTVTAQGVQYQDHRAQKLVFAEGYHYQVTTPVPEAGQRLEERLAQVLRLPFEVVAHRAAVRPAVRDRRPLLGQHPKHAALYLLNGLGAKGASLGPYCAEALLGLMAQQQALHPDVDLQRFAHLYPAA